MAIFFRGQTTLFVSARPREVSGVCGSMGGGLLSGYFGVSNRRHASLSVSALVDLLWLGTRVNSGSNATYCDGVQRASL